MNSVAWVLAVILIIVVMSVLVAGYQIREWQRNVTCHFTVKIHAEALTAYAADYEGKLPERFWKHIVGTHGCKSVEASFKSGYALHNRWLREPLPTSAEAADLILLYESGPAPFAYRHYGGMNVGFADGHVEFCKKADLTPAKITAGKR